MPVSACSSFRLGSFSCSICPRAGRFRNDISQMAVLPTTVASSHHHFILAEAACQRFSEVCTLGIAHLIAGVSDRASGIRNRARQLVLQRFIRASGSGYAASLTRRSRPKLRGVLG